MDWVKKTSASSHNHDEDYAASDHTHEGGGEAVADPEVLESELGSQAGGDLDLVLSEAPDVGDILVVWAVTRNAVLTGPGTGWTEMDLTDVATDEYRGVWWREAESGESATVTVECGSGDSVIGLLVRMTGVSSPTVFDSAFDQSGSDGLDAPSVSGLEDAILICAWNTHFDTGTFTDVPSGMTELDRDNSAPNDTRALAAYEILGSAGSTGTKTPTSSIDAWSGSVSVLVPAAASSHDHDDDYAAIDHTHGDTFSIVLIPDTQNLAGSSGLAAHFQSAADWIDTNKDDRNIALVAHLGDVVDNGGTTEFDRMDGPMDTIWDSGVPFAACIGNHDYDGGAPAADRSDTTNWNSYFGTGKYTGRSWWDGEFYETDQTENFYFTVNLGGRPTLVLVLEFYPRAAVLTWAGDLIEDHPTHDVVIVTHSYLNDDGTLTADGTSHGPNSYAPTDASSGVTMWAEFKQYENVVAIFNGHHIGGPDNFAVLEGEGDEGNEVFQQYSNFQEETDGGEGRIVILTVNPFTGWATREVYNPADDAFESTHELTFQLYQVAGSSNTDSDAIHDNESGEIAAVTEKATPHNDDLLLIEDSEDSNSKKSLKVGSLPSGGGASELDDLSDVDTTGASEGQVLKLNASGDWVPANDDTGSGSLPAATTKGDLAVYDGSDWVRVAAGSDDTVLTADAAESAGVKWAAGGGGGGSSVSLVGVEHTGSSDTGDTNVELTLPAGIQEDDLIVVTHVFRNTFPGDGPNVVDSGWTLVDLRGNGLNSEASPTANDNAGVWAKWATGAQSTVDFQVDDDGTDGQQWTAIAVRGAVGIEDLAYMGFAGADCRTVKGTDGGLLFCVWQAALFTGSYTAPPGDMTERTNSSSGFNDTRSMSATKALTESGQTGLKRATRSGTPNHVSNWSISFF